MTPKEKALDLINKFDNDLITTVLGDTAFIDSPKCALIAIDFAMEFITGDLSESFDKTMYLLEVKKEINKL